MISYLLDNTTKKTTYWLLIAFSCLLSVLSIDVQEQAIWLIILFFLLSTYPIVYYGFNSWIINPVNWCLAFYFLIYGSGAYHSLFSEFAVTYNLPKKYIINQLIYAILCSICFLVGYYFIGKLKLNKSRFNLDFSNRRIKSLLMWCFIFAIVGRIFAIANGSYYLGVHLENGAGEKNLNNSASSFALIFHYFYQLSTLLIFLIGFQYWERNKKTYKSLFICTVLLFIVFELPSGSKEKVILPVFFTLIIYVYFTKHTPVLLLLIFAFIVQFLVFPFYKLYRLNPEYGIEYAWKNYMSKYDLSDLQQLADISEENSSVRLNAAGIQAKIMYLHENGKAYKNGEDYLTIITALVPRFIWTDKPVVSTGNDFGREYGFLQYNDYTTVVGRYWQGEAFINFGWYGCLIGIFLGYFLRVLRRYLEIEKCLLGLFLFYTISYTFLRADQQVSFFNGTFKMLIIYFIIFSPFLIKIKKADSKMFLENLNVIPNK